MNILYDDLLLNLLIFIDHIDDLEFTNKRLY